MPFSRDWIETDQLAYIFFPSLPFPSASLTIHAFRAVAAVVFKTLLMMMPLRVRHADRRRRHAERNHRRFCHAICVFRLFFFLEEDKAAKKRRVCAVKDSVREVCEYVCVQ